MTEQSDALADLHQASALDALRWATGSTYDRVLDDYDPDTGHTQGWVGTSAYYLLVDRLDRVFSCGKYSLDDDGNAHLGQDVLQVGLRSQEDFDRMPVIIQGTVVRDNLNGSPGWRYGNWRWLLSSAPFGGSDSIPWPQKSPTKQDVAKRMSPDEPILFTDEELGVESADIDDFGATLILVHTVNKDSGIRELFLGRSRLNDGGGYGWHWKSDLFGETPTTTGRGVNDKPDAPSGGDKSQVPDVVVRLRKKAAKHEDGGGSISK